MTANPLKLCFLAICLLAVLETVGLLATYPVMAFWKVELFHPFGSSLSFLERGAWLVLGTAFAALLLRLLSDDQ